MSLEDTFLSFATRKLDSLMGRIEECVARLTPEQVWARTGENQNAIGNLLLHLNGNVRQWILGGVCGEPVERDRDAEFAARGGRTPAEMLAALRMTVNQAVARLVPLPHGRLKDTLNIQGYEVTALEAIAHVVEHFAGHAFQIFYITKMFTGADLGFYAHLSKKQAAPEPLP
jgi:hypothetical protein